MQEFMLIFRNSDHAHQQPSPEVLQERMEWLDKIVAQQQLADQGNRLSSSLAKTVKPGAVVTDGPYTEIKEFISGYVVVKTHTLEEAVELAKANPILKYGGSVEVRAILRPGEHG
ncbi:YciI family protein [Chitinophaga vietnamensis]|uniref:YciI family protein n=1 Tax=Chitinophaga vietnamensis TaxID=2593957 RepID=UPI0011781DAB|nr:YciI family protein [Chitinophaga vietnamensis]